MTDDTKVTLKINGKEVTAERGTKLIEVAKESGVEVPHFCYHKKLSIPANCRMCMVEVKGAPKPLPSCYTEVAQDMEVFTNSEIAQKAQKGVMELLLINHPLDCPICDQGGMCDLQDLAVGYGSDRSRYIEAKRAVPDKNLGPLIRTVMTRCIHCTRCIRFATEVAGVPEMGATGRGEEMQVGTYVEKALESELSGNMIDLCPVGALCSKPYSFTGRPWEMEETPSIDVMDALGSHIKVYHRDGKVMRIDPRPCDEINEEWISDTARFSYDGLYNNRLTTPYIQEKGKLVSTGWDNAFEKIKTAVKKSKPEAIAGLSGKMLSAEDLFSFRAFMKDVLKTDHIDGRLGGQFLPTLEERNLYTFGNGVESIDESDFILLIGTDPKLEAPVLNARLRKATQRGVEVALLGTEVNLTYPITYLGNTPQILLSVIAGEHALSKKLQKAQKPMVILGAEACLGRVDGVSLLKTVQDLAEQYGITTKQWNGFNVLHQNPGSVTALDLGVFPQKEHLSQAPKDSAEIAKAAKKGALDLLVLYGDVNLPVADLRKAKTVIYIGTHSSVYAQMADIVLPVAAYTEKNALWVNTEGRIQEGKRAVMPPLQAKEDWKVFRALSGVLGAELPFNTQKQLRAQLEEVLPLYKERGVLTHAKGRLDHAGQLSDEPFKLPVTQFYKTNEVLQASSVMTQTQDLANARKEAQLQKKVG